MAMDSGPHASLHTNCHHQLVKELFDITPRQTLIISKEQLMDLIRSLFLIIVMSMIRLTFNEKITNSCIYTEISFNLL